MLTHRNLVANTFHFQACWRSTPTRAGWSSHRCSMPPGSIAVLADGLARGAACRAAAPSTRRRRSTSSSAERVTATLVVPTMLAAISEEQLARPRDVSSLAMLSHGGSPVATETLRRAHAAFPDAELLHLYGATETAPIATALPHEERILDTPLARSCGQPAVGVEIAVLDDAGAAQPQRRGRRGRRPRRQRDARLLEQAGGDRAGARRRLVPHAATSATMDEDGYLFLVDRAKDMIVTGGENVYSTEVEDVLYRHPAVLEAAVFGIPDERWGEAVHAVVVPRAPTSTAGELIAFCRDVDRRLQGAQADRDTRRAAAEVGRGQGAQA